MATNKIYADPGSTFTFEASGGDVGWTPQNTASLYGRISAVWDRGSGAKPARYKWRCTTRWVATPSYGDCLRLYLVTSSASATPAVTDGGYTFGDAQLSTENPLLADCTPIGGVAANSVDQPYCASGIVYIYDRYVAIAAFNASTVSSKALTNTAGDHYLTLTEVPDEIEAAS